MSISKNSNITFKNTNHSNSVFSYQSLFQTPNQTSRTSFTSLANHSSTIDSNPPKLHRKNQLKPTNKLNISAKILPTD